MTIPGVLPGVLVMVSLLVWDSWESYWADSNRRVKPRDQSQQQQQVGGEVLLQQHRGSGQQVTDCLSPPGRCAWPELTPAQGWLKVHYNVWNHKKICKKWAPMRYAFRRFQESWYSYKGFLVILDGAVHLGLYMFCNREQSNKHLLNTHHSNMANSNAFILHILEVMDWLIVHILKRL